MTDDIPANHLRAHLGFHLEEVTEGSPHGLLPLGPRSIHRDGSVSLGAIATMVDVVGMRATGYDGPMVTSHLAIQMTAPPAGDTLRSSGRSARSGKSGGTSIVYVTDGSGAIVGVATLTGAALTPGGGTHTKRPDRLDDFFVRWPRPTGGPGPEDYIGLGVDEGFARQPDGARRYRVPFHETLRNVNGVLHGGGACLLAEQAARGAAVDAGEAGTLFDSLAVDFLAPGLTGPFLVRVETMPSASDRRTFVVEVFDAGRDERRITLAVLTGHAPR